MVAADIGRQRRGVLERSDRALRIDQYAVVRIGRGKLAEREAKPKTDCG
ncbi:MAG: hypothetical protein HW373_1272 [Deltaproteobacteria bacterium]|nr:hypothetical protein [Deltaproteobacteria bacterium]